MRNEEQGKTIDRKWGAVALDGRVPLSKGDLVTKGHLSRESVAQNVA